MISNTIVTITTSGTYIGLDGVCDNCLGLRDRKVHISLHEKTIAEKNQKVRTAVAADSTQALLHQGSGDQAQGSVTGSWADVSRKTDGRLTSLDKIALQKSHSIDTAKLKSTCESRSSTASERRNSAPVGTKISPQNCQCVCQGWAEIFIRRPSGNISWIMRIQNRETKTYLDSDVSVAVVDDPQIGEGELLLVFVFPVSISFHFPFLLVLFFHMKDLKLF